MGASGSGNPFWGGRLWLVGLIALLLTVVILVILFPRPMAWTAPPPTSLPWTPAPDLYQVPTLAPPAPSPTPQGGLSAGMLVG